MACPWSSIDIDIYQGEWWCVCCGEGMGRNVDFYCNEEHVIGSFKYTKNNQGGWFMCGNCNGVWQHTHSPSEDEDFKDTLGYVHHICKFSTPPPPINKFGKPVRMGSRSFCQTGLLNLSNWFPVLFCLCFCL